MLSDANKNKNKILFTEKAEFFVFYTFLFVHHVNKVYFFFAPDILHFVPEFGPNFLLLESTLPEGPAPKQISAIWSARHFSTFGKYKTKQELLQSYCREMHQ